MNNNDDDDDDDDDEESTEKGEAPKDTETGEQMATMKDSLPDAEMDALEFSDAGSETDDVEIIGLD